MKHLLTSKMKGQSGMSVGTIPAIVLTIVLVGFYLTFGGLIMQTMKITTYGVGEQTVNTTLTTVRVNETRTITAPAGTGQAPGTSAGGYTLVAGYNTTTGNLIPTTNYSFVSNGATATYTQLAMTNNMSNITIVYTSSYSMETNATIATANSEAALNVFSTNLPLLALVMFFAIVLGVIAVLASTGRISV